MNKNYREKLESELSSIHRLYDFLNKKEQIEISFSQLLLHGIKLGIYDNRILEITHNNKKDVIKKTDPNNIHLVEKKKHRNKWLSFLKDYSERNNISFGKAMKDPNAKIEYKKEINNLDI